MKMSVSNFEDLLRHTGHPVQVQNYIDNDGNVINCSIECIECNEVLINFDKDQILFQIPCSSITRDDVANALHNEVLAESFTDDEMIDLAEDMHTAHMNVYWDDLKILAEGILDQRPAKVEEFLD
jgi:hypothetical protein